LDWSYDLLSARERLLFGRLAVFAGGWTLDAAELVCAGGGIRSDDVLDLLERLIDKSLVLAESGSAGSMRYGLLQTNRDYALERLVERGELKSTERRHTDFFLALIEEALPYLRAQGEAQGRWLERLDRERDNLRAALHHAIERQQAETAARYVLALWRYWLNRGYLAEGQRWLALVLELIGPAPTPARLEMTNAAALREEVGHPHSANDRYDVDRYLSAANAALGVEAMEHARTEGRAMPVDVAFAYALA
jgi:predicted ATPase